MGRRRRQLRPHRWTVCARVDRRLPALSSLRGQSPAQDTRWPAVGKRVMSMPISATITRATMSLTPGIVVKILARASERQLASIIATLGEERHARAVARAIVAARGEQAIRTTSELAAIVARVVRGRPGDIHPATRTFQALRIFINDELRSLADGLVAAERLLARRQRHFGTVAPGRRHDKHKG